MLFVFLYLAAAVLANLSAMYFGPVSTPINAFLLISLDLTARDRLHEAWQGRNLWVKMAALIITGSALTYLINAGALRIAVASSVAFIAAGVADTIVYQVLRKHPRLLKINSSNAVSATVDSFLFPTIAFGGFIWRATLGQLIAKVFGGYLWALLLTKTVWKEPAKASA